MKVFPLLITFLFTTQLILGQSIVRSEEFSVRNDRFYDFFTFKNLDKTIVFREGQEKSSFISLDRDLKTIKNLEFKNNHYRSALESIVRVDTVLQLIYSYKFNRKYFIDLYEYNVNKNSIDSISTLSVSNEKIVQGPIKSIASADNTKTLLFGTINGKIKYLVVDNISRSVYYEGQIIINEVNIKDDFRKIILSNNGQISIIFEKNNKKFSRANHKIICASNTASLEEFTIDEIDLSNTVNSGIECILDEDKGMLYIAGLYAEKNLVDLIGYFVTSIDLTSGYANRNIQKFPPELKQEIFGFSDKRNKSIKDFYLKDLILRKDGGVLLISEMEKEFVRRASYSTMSRYDGTNFASRGFVDYYHEDLLIINLKPDFNIDWQKVLYKKQFSQDDNGSFSSYFAMKTPSRLRLIYNDEIKKSNTVSEYMISPSGKYERNAMINTQYQNLQLRFRNALQIDNKSLIIPSENNFKLSLVKLTIDN